MRQILFYVGPFPLYGYGFMLLSAYFFCTWLAVRVARRDGIPTESLHDLAICLIGGGILGARITYVARYWGGFRDDWLQTIQFWDGGLIFYGSIPAALLGYIGFYWFVYRKHGVSNWKMADLIAACTALGLCLGRVGCLLNGCCYGNVACTECPAVSFPLPAAPRYDMVKRGYQTPAGFVTHPGTTAVAAVEPGSAAAQAGLRPDDVIVAVNPSDPQARRQIATYGDLAYALAGPGQEGWPRGRNDLELAVVTSRGQEKTLGPFVPRGIGLHPTQIYESISMALLLFFLLSYYPFKRRDGMVMVLFMIGYAVHRLLNETLRTDTEIVAFGMTFSQNISILVIVAAVVLGIFTPRRPPTVDPPVATGGLT
jgi:phosphatidylglycerol:prolipoprotein diacylglycerol transferase